MVTAHKRPEVTADVELSFLPYSMVLPQSWHVVYILMAFIEAPKLGAEPIDGLLRVPPIRMRHSGILSNTSGGRKMTGKQCEPQNPAVPPLWTLDALRPRLINARVLPSGVTVLTPANPDPGPLASGGFPRIECRIYMQVYNLGVDEHTCRPSF